MAKILETEIAKVNGDTLIVDTLSSANGFSGINHFNVNQTYDLTMTTSSLEADVLTKNATVDYKVVKVLGTSNLIWITNSMSNIKTPNDIKTFKPSFIGVTGPGPTLMGKRMCEFLKYQCDVVPFRSLSDMWIPFFNNEISTALVAATPEVLTFAKQGKLQIVGNTSATTITIDGQKVPSIPNTLGGAAYQPMLFLGARKSMPDAKLDRILASVDTVLNKPEIREQIQKEFLLYPYTAKINNIDELVKENANSIR
jgi:tripartite-type tricarboxylate transporter receptor subunit TctC